jgi:predicted nucleic acid-binding protein
MILVDTSVWIDYFNGSRTPATDRLDELLGEELLLTGDIILAEVLQGFRTEPEYRRAQQLLDRLEFRPMLGREVALQAARNYRELRKKGVTPRKTIDVMIASFCLQNDHRLLHSDRDFDPMADILGLQVVV